MMLSPGQFWKIIPKDYEANIRFRIEVLKAAFQDERIQKGLFEICRQDILFWINLFVWQFNPDTRERGPFISYDFQDAAIVGGNTIVGETERFQHGILQCLEDQEDVRWQKSRYVGASWLVLMLIVWLCLFHENIKAFAISKDEDAVDNGEDPDSLFWKARHIIEYLPAWMSGLTKKKKPRKMLIVFPNGNILNGDANAVSSGVGGRNAIMLVDEFGQFDKNGEEIYSMTTDTCYCRVFVYTHKNQTGMAYRLTFDPKYKHMREIITHWSQHPERQKGLYKYNDNTNRIEIIDKSYEYPPDYEFVMEKKPAGGPCVGIRSPWYDKQCRRREDRDVAMNLDIDPRGASKQFFDSYRISIIKAEHGREPRWTGNLIYDDKTARAKKLEFSTNGLLKLWVNPKSDVMMPTMRCGAAVDVSAGTGETPSCLSVWNSRTGEKVAQYANAKIYSKDFAAFCVAFLSLIKDEDGLNPLLCWEVQGSQVFEQQTIEVFHYFPCYERRDESVLGALRINKRKYGWVPNPKSILTLMDDYRQMLFEERVINRCEDALDECLNMVYIGNSVEYQARGLGNKKALAESGARVHHGDIVRADALGVKMLKQLGFEEPDRMTSRAEVIDPRTFDGRERLHELQMQQAEMEVWS